MKSYVRRWGFTLIELLIVIAVVAILAVVVVLTLNPIQLLQQGRDANRVADMTTLNKAISLYYQDAINQPSTLFMGTSSIIYLSIPDPTATSSAGTNCAGLGFPSTGYHCPASSTYRNTNGTGWIPIDFASSTTGSSISALSVDPLNSTSSGEYYEYETDAAGNWEVVSAPESQKYTSQPSDFSAGTTSSFLSTLSVFYSSATYPTGGSDPIYPTFDSHTNTIWVANQTNGTITKVNDTTYATSTYTVGSAPYATAFDPHTNTVWVTNSGSNTVTQINDTTYAMSTYTVGSEPLGIVFDPHTNTIWVANSNGNTVTQINDTTYAMSTYSVGTLPALLTFDSNTNTIWVGNQNVAKVSQINDTTYATSSYTVGGIEPTSVAFDSHTNTIWVADDGSANVTQINDTTYATSSYPVGSGPNFVAFDPHTNSVFVTNQGSNTLVQINDTSYATTTYITGTQPRGIAIDSNSALWVANQFSPPSVTEFVPNR